MENQKIAVVTGASRGIGKAIAVELVGQGYTVVGTATSESGAEKISQYLQALGNNGFGHSLNVTDMDSIEQFSKTVLEKLGTPAVLVNNAAITNDNLLMRMKDEQWLSVINTNLNAVYFVVKAFLRPMIKAKFGRIVNITSVVGVTGNFGQSNYAAAKAGVIGFTKSAAQELARYNITVNAIAPGFIQTDMTSGLSEKAEEAINQKIPQGRKGLPEEIAGGVGYLVSDKAAYITGETLHINGGMFMC